jgi:hypothetical protein
MPTPAPKPAAPWWRHKVVIGLLATVLAGITSRWGVDADELTAILLQVAEVAGLVLAAWGTVPAQRSLLIRLWLLASMASLCAAKRPFTASRRRSR